MLCRPHFIWLRALIWVLCLALPLQAAAVSSMRGCGPITVSQAMPFQTTASPTAAPSHEHEHHSGIAQADIDASAGEAGASPETHHGNNDSAHQQCSACAACFVGAALPSAAVAVAVPVGHAVQHCVSEWASLTGTPDRLERPPRIAAV